MATTYGLISIFGEDTQFIKTSKSLAGLVALMKEQAIDYICDRVGKNNYIDTLGEEYADKDIKEYPEGYVLKMCNDYTYPRVKVFLRENTPGYILSLGYIGGHRGYTFIGEYIIAEQKVAASEVSPTTTKRETSSRAVNSILRDDVSRNYANIIPSIQEAANKMALRRGINKYRCDAKLKSQDAIEEPALMSYKDVIVHNTTIGDRANADNDYITKPMWTKPFPSPVQQEELFIDFAPIEDTTEEPTAEPTPSKCYNFTAVERSNDCNKAVDVNITDSADDVYETELGRTMRVHARSIERRLKKRHNRGMH